MQKMDDRMNINWYPGHMKKTKELLQKNLKLVDIVVELLDSRIPFSSKNPDVDRIIKDKPKVVVLNKFDMADPSKIKLWQDYYESQGIEAIPVNTISGKGVDKVIQACREAMREKMEALMKKGRNERAIRLMIVGVPNVGKSTLINKLAGRKSTQTGDRPGITKSNQWVKLKGDLELLDTPGILWPRFEDENVAMNLAFTRAIKDEILDIETLALRFIEKLEDRYPDNLKERYKLEELGQTPLETMEMIGVKRGCLMARKEIDYTRVAKIVLNEFREGKTGKMTLEIPKDFKK